MQGFFRKESQEWFTSQVQLQIENGVTPEEVKVDTKISILKTVAWEMGYIFLRQNSITS